MIAGDDMRLKFRHAIHINEPKEDEDQGPSRMILLSPHALQEVTRKTTSQKQALRDHLPSVRQIFSRNPSEMDKTKSPALEHMTCWTYR